MKAIILDTETTGLIEKGQEATLQMQPHIIELGALFYDSDNGQVTRTVNQLLNPDVEIYDKELNVYTRKLPKIITKVTGIKGSDLIGQPIFEEFMPFLFSFFKGAYALICHNAPFDIQILKFALLRCGDDVADNFPWPPVTYCTVQEYRAILASGKWPKLTELYEKILCKKLKQTHRALDDCNALLEILIADKFFEKLEETK